MKLINQFCKGILEEMLKANLEEIPEKELADGFPVNCLTSLQNYFQRNSSQNNSGEIINDFKRNWPNRIPKQFGEKHSIEITEEIEILN